MKAEYSSKLARALVALGLLGLLAGCAGGPSWGAWSQRPSDAEVAAVLARTEGTQVAQQGAPARQEPTAFVASSDR